MLSLFELEEMKRETFPRMANYIEALGFINALGKNEAITEVYNFVCVIWLFFFSYVSTQFSNVSRSRAGAISYLNTRGEESSTDAITEHNTGAHVMHLFS